MATISYHHNDGRIETVDAPPGTSVMRAAVTNGVTGIIGECGGQAMCATCHVYVRPAHIAQLPAMAEDEQEMLECVAAPRDPARSRLSCQLPIDDNTPDIQVDVPDVQI